MSGVRERKKTSTEWTAKSSGVRGMLSSKDVEINALIPLSHNSIGSSPSLRRALLSTTRATPLSSEPLLQLNFDNYLTKLDCTNSESLSKTINAHTSRARLNCVRAIAKESYFI